MDCIWRGGIVILGCLLAMQAALAGPLGDKFNRWLLGTSQVPVTAPSTLEFELDDIAQGCMQCHNGSRAAHIALKSAGTPMQFSSDGVQSNHPVGMSYDRYASAKSHQYVPRFALDPNVVLVDGNVTCISCHRLKDSTAASVVDQSGNIIQANWIETDGAEPDPESCSASAELTVGPKEHDLCLACHNM